MLSIPQKKHSKMQKNWIFGKIGQKYFLEIDFFSMKMQKVLKKIKS